MRQTRFALSPDKLIMVQAEQKHFQLKTGLPSRYE